MHKHFAGEGHDALQTIGGTLKHVARITRGKDYGPEGFGDHEIMKDLHTVWPKDEDYK